MTTTLTNKDQDKIIKKLEFELELKDVQIHNLERLWLGTLIVGFIIVVLIVAHYS